jgi:hypothetical protein
MWTIATYIVSCNKLRNAINCCMIDIHSKTSKQKCYNIVTMNTYKKCSIHNHKKYIIKQIMFTKKTRYLAPFFNQGMKIIIIESLYLKLRVVNGSIGYIKKISLVDVKWIHKDITLHTPINILVNFNDFKTC